MFPMSHNLEKIDNFSRRPGPVLLVILDGVGLGEENESNGVYMAKTPCLDSLMKSDLYTTLRAHGMAVGMPSDDDMGNSEVGHNALGAGRVFDQGATLVQNSIKEGKIFKTETWNQLIEGASKDTQTFHIIGLLSDGNVHSHIDHFLAVLNQCAQRGIKRVRIHALLDGRDVYEKSALEYIQKIEELTDKLKEQGCDYRIASGGGRMITTMDRYNADWSIVKRGWDTHVLGLAKEFSSAREAVETLYKEDPSVNDQYLPAFVITEKNSPIGTIEDGDSVVFMNFRGDRAIELSMAFDQGDEFDKFDRVRVPKVFYAGMMQYDGDLHIPKHYLVDPPEIDSAVSVYMCDNGIKSFAISETQKYGHVTYFWNGNKSGFVNEELETYVEIPSDKIQFEKAPKMKAFEITEKSIELMKTGEYQFGRINFPNGDMVGHTGVPKAIIESVEAADQCLAKLLETIKELKGVVVVLADHGNADVMFTEKNGKRIVNTAHSLNPVPFAIFDPSYQGEYKIKELDKRGLSNVAATLLNLLGFKQPADYDPSLIMFK